MNYQPPPSPFPFPLFHGLHRLGRQLLPVAALPAGAVLYRGYHRPDADWVAPPPAHRKGRVCPPPGNKDRYGILYLAESPDTVDFEVGRLRVVMSANAERVERSFQPGRRHQLACHVTTGLALFADLDSPFIWEFSEQVGHGGVDRIEAWQTLALRIHTAVVEHEGSLVAPMVGLTYRSRRRGCAGTVFAVFEDARDKFLRRGGSRPLP
jgi:hypothetical protein